jgi:hypothetical protein
MPCNLSRLISAWQSSCSHAWSSYCQRRRHSRKTMPYAANPRPLHPAPVPCPLWWQALPQHTLGSFSSTRAPVLDSKPAGLSLKLCARMPHNTS